jgi:transketolase
MDKKSQNFEERVQYLKEKAKEVRVNIIDMIFTAQSGHPGGALSAADIMTALYFNILKIDPKNPRWPDRDRFILSKGHACPVWYSCLAMRGYFPIKELKTLRKFESILQGHPDMLKTPGVDITTGSLGQGLSLGVGMALEGKLVKKAIIDKNKLQMDGLTNKVMPMDPIDKKFEAFNWYVITINGHDMKAILIALERAKKIKGKPVCIITNTVKGKGVSFMENIREWHGKAPNQQEYKKAIKEIEESNNEVK